MRALSFACLLALASLTGCGSESADTSVPAGPVQGQRIDGTSELPAGELPREAPRAPLPEAATQPELDVPPANGGGAPPALDTQSGATTTLAQAQVPAPADSEPKEPTSAELLAQDHLTFGDLALSDESLDQLLDVLLALEDFPTEPFEFPQAIEGLEDKQITVLGYMIPTQWEESKVTAFMLVGDLLACCFGGTPQPDAWIDVTMEGEGTKYLPYTPVLVKGTFHISSEMPENGYFVGVYRMDGTEVVREE